MVVKTAPANSIPLQNGEELARDEFERRYEAMPNVKAELIEGVVHMASPVLITQHANPHWQMVLWLGQYQMSTPGIAGANDGTIRLDLDNEPQPDAFLYISPSKGGQLKIDKEDYAVGAPELVAEVSGSTASIDLKKKLPVYCRNGVLEYIVWRVYDQEIDWFVLRGSSYEPIPADEFGIRMSEVFPGLWLDSAALLRNDMNAVCDTVRRGLATREHEEFVKRVNG